ncbi:MAG: hypothetical protein KC431_01200 [Myxococcales bacterium]|nr:hypothetical protein [Myxococcales bacterium]
MTRAIEKIPVACLGLIACLGLSACKSEAPKEEEKKEEKQEPAPLPEPDNTPVEPRFDLSGPVPPETSAVLFSVDGSLLPIGCFDKAKNALASGSDCAALVAEGSEVYMEDSFGKKALEKTGAGTANSLCGDEGALPVAALTEGAVYDWAVWPKSLGPTFKQISPDTWSDRGARLEEVEAKAVQAAMAKVRNVNGEFQPKQKASIDIDGDGKDELFVSAIMLNPSDPDTYLVSGLFVAMGGDLGTMTLVEKAKPGRADVIRLRGVVDLDGDGKRELWTGVLFDGGNGDHVVQFDGTTAKPLSKWTCGA